jgi:hypothetical protein
MYRVQWAKMSSHAEVFNAVNFRRLRAEPPI